MSLPQTETQNPKAELDAVVEAIRSHDRFLVTTHENPDGDALGSILAMKLALEQLGKDAFLYLSGIISLPSEYAFMDLGAVSRELPADAEQVDQFVFRLFKCSRINAVDLLMKLKRLLSGQVPPKLSFLPHNDRNLALKIARFFPRRIS